MQNLKNKLLSFLLIQSIILGNILSAQGLFQLTNHPKTASGWGMSSAISSLNNNINGIFLNPATLANSPGFYHANFTNFVLDINSTSVGFGSETKYFKYAANISYLNFGDFIERDDEGNDLGDFSANDKELFIIFAKKIGQYISAGFSTSFLNSKIDNYSANSLSLGFGLQYYYPKQNLSIGISLNNYDKMFDNYSSKNENIPNLILFGISKQLQYLPAIISFDLFKYKEIDPLFNLGIKFIPKKHFRIFLGTSSKKIELQNHADIKSLISGVSGGVGFSKNSYNFDVSYSSLGDAGEITSFSFYKLLN